MRGTGRYREFEARCERSASEEFLVGPHTADEGGGRLDDGFDIREGGGWTVFEHGMGPGQRNRILERVTLLRILDDNAESRHVRSSPVCS